MISLSMRVGLRASYCMAKAFHSDCFWAAVRFLEHSEAIVAGGYQIVVVVKRVCRVMLANIGSNTIPNDRAELSHRRRPSYQ